MDTVEKFSLLMLVLAYMIIVMLIVVYEVTECRKPFYTLAIILLTILFLYFLHVALYHCPRSHFGYKGEREEENQTRSPTGGFPTI